MSIVRDVSAVIFDMYETLVPNPESSWISVFGQICQTQQLAIDPKELYSQWKQIESGFRRTRLNLEKPAESPPFKSYQDAWRECFEQVFAKMRVEGDAIGAVRAAVLSLSLRDPFGEVGDSLAIIQRRWKTAVLSNADNDFLQPLLVRLKFRFNAVLTSETVEAYKPHPHPFHRILEELALDPGETVYVGDSQFDDVLGAKGVGMGTIWVNRYGKSLNCDIPSPDYEVSSLAELPGILERWNP